MQKSGPVLPVVLLDIEGTTTPVSFVYEVLFPFARKNLAPFLAGHFEDPQVTEAIGHLVGDHAREAEAGADPPPLSRGWRSPAAGFCEWLMDADRKATGLKAVQGLIWRDGYESGDLKASLYDDVLPAFDRWISREAAICIYSSGSVLAQKLLFAHTTYGDLTPYLSGYFDTQTGAKKEPGSYSKIASEVECNPHEVLFLSDSLAEVDAAREAGMETGLVARDPSESPPNSNGHRVITDFSAER